MPPIQPSFDLLAAKAQDLAKEKTTTAKNMAFAFDIDGVLVHGDRLIPEARRALQILNGDNELGIKVRNCICYKTLFLFLWRNNFPPKESFSR
jgi:hypothetical protein